VPLDEPYFAAGRAEDSILFPKKLHFVQHFWEKEKKRTMLPQAMLLFGGSNTWFERPPRNSCNFIAGV